MTGLVYITYLLLTMFGALKYFSVREETGATRTNGKLSLNVPSPEPNEQKGPSRPTRPPETVRPRTIPPALAVPAPGHVHIFLSSGM